MAATATATAPAPTQQPANGPTHAPADNTQTPVPVTGPSPHIADLTITRGKDAVFNPKGLRAFFQYRDLGIYKASHGAAIAHVIKAVPGMHAEGIAHRHPEVTFQFVYMLKGWAVFEYEGPDGTTITTKVEQGDSIYQPPGIRHRQLDHSEDVEILEIVTPGDFGSEIVERV